MSVCAYVYVLVGYNSILIVMLSASMDTAPSLNAPQQKQRDTVAFHCSNGSIAIL